MLNKAKEKFKICAPMEGHILNDYLSWGALKKLVEEIPHQPVLDDFLKLYSFKFKEIKL
jgi:hypothetical protein